MKSFAIRSVKRIGRALLYGIAGGCAVLVVVFVLYLESRPDLKDWHMADLDAEFTTESPARSFADYLVMEKQLFDQLDERVYSRVPPGDQGLISRYRRGSLSDPGRWTPNWNRTFELSTDAPRAGVLLLHGMSDSPYSLRSFGQRLNAEGAWVIGLRLPGHGTAPPRGWSGFDGRTWMRQFSWRCAACVIRPVKDRSTSWAIPTAAPWP